MNRQHRNLPLEVRREYGESLTEVIKGYALMGYSRRAIAEILNVPESTFHGIVKRFGLESKFNTKNYNESCKARSNKPRSGRPKGIPGPRRHTDEELLLMVRRYPSQHSFDLLSGSSSTTVRRWFGSWSNAKRLAGVVHG